MTTWEREETEDGFVIIPKETIRGVWYYFENGGSLETNGIPECHPWGSAILLPPINLLIKYYSNRSDYENAVVPEGCSVINVEGNKVEWLNGDIVFEYECMQVEDLDHGVIFRKK